MAKGKEEELGDDFSTHFRMADTDMDGLKPLSSALTSVKGIGVRSAIQICKTTGFDLLEWLATLSPEQQETLRLAIEDYVNNVPYWMVNRLPISKPATTST